MINKLKTADKLGGGGEEEGVFAMHITDKVLISLT